MKPEALEKCRDRFRSCENHFDKLKKSKNYAEMRPFWYDFLVASSSIFSILEQGAKGSNRSAPWFGAKKHERADDPLLSYLHHARNADEHGISAVTKLDKPKIVLVAGGKPVAAVGDITGNTGTFQNLDSGDPDLSKVTEMRVYRERAKLVDVVDRGKVYAVPMVHLRKPIDGSDPIIVAGSLISYLGLLLDEAEPLV